jgi:hypothetical protein
MISPRWVRLEAPDKQAEKAAVHDRNPLMGTGFPVKHFLF